MTESNLFPISSFLSPLLPLSGPSAKPLGPLLFTPSPETLTLIFSSPSLIPPFPPIPRLPLRRFIEISAGDDTYVPPSLRSSIAGDLSSQSDDTTPPIVSNNLQVLRCPNDDVLIFFPIGENWERVGFVVLSVKDSAWRVRVNKNGDVITTTNNGFAHRIHKLFVSPVADSGWDSSSSLKGNSVIIGFLLACTLYSIHWFSVEIREVSSILKEPSLVYLGTKIFKTSSVVHACWNPHLSEESVVLLESGELFLFDLGPCSRTRSLRGKLKGTRIRIPWNDVDSSEEGSRWLSCEFSWHPRILIVASATSVFLVDWRFGESNVSVLAKIEMLYMNNSIEKERFIAFSKAGVDGYCFAVATDYWLLVFDIRNPLMPVLQWVHGLDNPCYMNVFRLSELRSDSKEDEYKWASESGFGILLGSFWNCEFSLFCYGPSLPAPSSSIASKVAKYCNTLYPWELPSELPLSGRECHCGDCLVKEDFLKEALPVWIDWQQKKEIVLGFGILDKDLSGSQIEESGKSGGFTLIRLMTSGKVESQKYHASWDYIKKSEESGEEALIQFKDSLLYHLVDQKYKFPRRFKYLKLEFLYGYLNGNLAKIMCSKMQNTQTDPWEKKTISEVLREKLKACGVDHTGPSPVIIDVFKDISLPTSIHEIALKKMWAHLPMDLLNFAFSSNLEVLEILVDQKKPSLEFLDVSDVVPQLPPFLLRKPSIRSNKWSHKVQPGTTLAGPVLPLPILLTLHEVHKEEADGLSAETEVIQECSEVMKVANTIVMLGSCSELSESHAVSLANDREEDWSGSQERKPFFIYKPQAFSDTKSPTVEVTLDKPFPKDESFATFVSKMHEKEEHTLDFKKEPIGLEVFDELCPIELKFDSPAMNFEMKELKGYKLLKRQFSKWQEGFKPYQDFCTRSKIQKRDS